MLPRNEDSEHKKPQLRGDYTLAIWKLLLLHKQTQQTHSGRRACPLQAAKMRLAEKKRYQMHQHLKSKYEGKSTCTIWKEKLVDGDE
eukprot:1161075-Pelagomonas_calceolata.AAC.10